jgi:hypothetical protein
MAAPILLPFPLRRLVYSLGVVVGSGGYFVPVRGTVQPRGSIVKFNCNTKILHFAFMRSSGYERRRSVESKDKRMNKLLW